MPLKPVAAAYDLHGAHTRAVAMAEKMLAMAPDNEDAKARLPAYKSRL